MNEIILNENCLFYGDSNSAYENIKEVLKISPNTRYEFDSENKYIYSLQTNQNIKEFIFCDKFKVNVLQKLIQDISRQYTFKYNKNSKFYIIFNKCHHISVKSMYIFKQLLEKAHDFNYIFISNNYIPLLSSWCFTKYIPPPKNAMYANLNSLMKNDIQTLSQKIFEKTFNINSIRKDLFSLMFNYQDIALIIKELLFFCIEKKPENAFKYVEYASECQRLHVKGNKDIFYLEYFILLMINNAE